MTIVMFILGFIIGFIVFGAIFAITLYYRFSMQKTTDAIERKVKNASQPRGSIYIPPEEADETREEIINRNRAKGQDTHINELR